MVVAERALFAAIVGKVDGKEFDHGFILQPNYNVCDNPTPLPFH